MMGTQKKKKKTKERNSFLQVVGSSVSYSAISIGGILGSISLGSWRLSSLVGGHFLVKLLQVELLQIHSRWVLHEISSQKLKPLEVPAKKYSVVLLDLLEARKSISYRRLYRFGQRYDIFRIPVNTGVLFWIYRYFLLFYRIYKVIFLLTQYITLATFYIFLWSY